MSSPYRLYTSHRLFLAVLENTSIHFKYVQPQYNTIKSIPKGFSLKFVRSCFTTEIKMNFNRNFCGRYLDKAWAQLFIIEILNDNFTGNRSPGFRVFKIERIIFINGLRFSKFW